MPDFVSREFLGIFLCPVFAVGATEIANVLYCDQLYRDSGDSNLGLHICRKSASPTEPSPPLCFTILKVCVYACAHTHTHMLKSAHTECMPRSTCLVDREELSGVTGSCRRNAGRQAWPQALYSRSCLTSWKWWRSTVKRQRIAANSRPAWCA